MDGLTFSKLMIILNKELTGAKLNRISVAGGSVYFSFYKGAHLNLEFRSAPTPPALFPVSEISGDSSGALSALSGADVSYVKAGGYERAGFIELKKRKPSGKLLTYKAVIEPAGNYANFLLLDENGTILYSLSSRTIDPDRNIGAGGKYSVPRPNKKYSLDKCDEAISFSDLAGFYPVTVRHASALAEEIGFLQAVSVIKDRILNDPLFYIDKAGKVIPFYIPDAVKTIDWQHIGEFYPKKETGTASRAIDSLKKMFSAKMNKYLKVAGKLQEELAYARGYGAVAEEAELIKSNLHLIDKSGDYIFERYTALGAEKVPYRVEYGEDMAAKADRLFKKAARLKKSVPMIEERLREAMQMALFAEEQVYYAENERDADDAAEFERLIAYEAKNGWKKDKRIMKKPFYEKIFDGYRIYAGRSSVSNHELVFRHGIDTDIWFHARNVPSAHVLLRLDGGRELTEEIINQCASVAAGLSKMKNQSRVEVDYTLRKYVNKPKNTPAGFVIYKRFKTVSVRPMSAEEINAVFERKA